MVKYIEIEDVEVTHAFVRKHINFLLRDEATYREFYEDFQKYFLRNVLTPIPFENLYLILNGHDIHEREIKYLKNNLRRIFINEQHFKGLVGEHLFAFYYHHMVNDLLWTHGPKGRSSAEPGIDFVTFTGDINNKDSIKVTVWETKTTENSVSTRARQIYDFFSENGSFEENIDSEIMAIQQLYNNREDNGLKEVIRDLYKIVVNREPNFCIGAAGVSPINNTTEDTFKKFAECFKDEITKEQRIVKFLFIELLNNILDDLRENIWNKLQAI